MHQCIVQVLRYAVLVQSKSGSWKLLLNESSKLKAYNHIPLFWKQKCFRSTCSEIIGETDLLLEDGVDIQELPVIVRKANLSEPLKSVQKELHSSQNSSQRRAERDREMREIIEGFDKCYTERSLFTLLELIPPPDITSTVALQALKTIIKFENSQEFKSKFEISLEDDETESFTKNAIINNLIDILITSEDNCEILEALQFISEEMSGEKVFLFRQKLRNEVLIRVADNKFNISEICSAARSLLFSGNRVDIDKLWVGLMERQNEINEKNIMDVFQMLLNVNLSRSFFMKILQKQLEVVLLNLKEENICEILAIFSELKEFPHHIVKCLLNWFKLKKKDIEEKKLNAIIEGFMLLPSVEESVVKALEEYVQNKKDKIKTPELVGTIMDYCNKYRVKSEIIFDHSSQYMIKNVKNISLLVLQSIFLPFGYLNVQPKDENFWKVLEEELSEKFTQLNAEDALDIMLCFILLEKYPITLVTKIFNPYFLDKLHSLKDPQYIHMIRTKLKLIDTALTLECKLYEGPLLLPDVSSSLIKQDSRIQRICDSLIEMLPQVIGANRTVASFVVLKTLPLTELYIVDIIVHPEGVSSLLNSSTSLNDFTALLIHLPEHYDSTGQHLVGLQAMRKRHFKRIGLNVVDLNYNTINSLLSKSELKDYLKAKMGIADVADHTLKEV